MADSLGLTASLFIALCLCKPTHGYGFRFPRHYDQIVMGETVNLTWDIINPFVSLHYVPTSIVGGSIVTVVNIAENISNRGWALWEIPTDLSSPIIGVPGYFMLTDGVTNDTILDTEYVTVMPTSTTPVPSPTLLGRFTAPTGAPNRSLTEGAAINFTWETDAQFVNLSFWTAANDPWPLFSLTPNPGWYVWTVKNIAAFLLPHYLKLESNDTSYIASPTIDSEGFYIEPSNYPVATPNTMSDHAAAIIYPQRRDTDYFAVNDTVVFVWDKPVPPAIILSMQTMGDTYFTWTTTDRFLAGFDDFTYTTTNFTLKIHDLYGFTDGMYGSSFHFNLVEESYRATEGEWYLTKLIARSDSFSIVLPSGPEKTWSPSAERLATSTMQPPSTPSSSDRGGSSNPSNSSNSGDSGGSGMTTTTKIAIGLSVPLGTIFLILLGFVIFWWRRKRRQQGSAGKRDRHLAGKEVHELEISRSPYGRHELLGKARPAELDGHQVHELPTPQYRGPPAPG
ncbi:uncharacterized protein PV07_05836 [Cladophialophora immunda]|uniref:Mid2 domain-containing protein n=1 Tax=Cladophialophora immunda TaxID=569365 RepID=A0A0D2D2Y4_9EURO|nr:uncharacterized protein PV07_05836 [Cladophialophora immunda]KIW30059.1 hypothetical protein PV07_05836 [Cladophialophora immunda]OQV06186.1 hypothetical protein CLAIMM_10798 [Cladophialophora immunda]